MKSSTPFFFNTKLTKNHPYIDIFISYLFIDEKERRIDGLKMLNGMKHNLEQSLIRDDRFLLINYFRNSMHVIHDYYFKGYKAGPEDLIYKEENKLNKEKTKEYLLYYIFCSTLFSKDTPEYKILILCKEICLLLFKMEEKKKFASNPFLVNTINKILFKGNIIRTPEKIENEIKQDLKITSKVIDLLKKKNPKLKLDYILESIKFIPNERIQRIIPYFEEIQKIIPKNLKFMHSQSKGIFGLSTKILTSQPI